MTVDAEAELDMPILRRDEPDIADVIDRLTAEADHLRQALRFYSDGFAYLTPEGWKRIWRDGGVIAREALAMSRFGSPPAQGQKDPS